MTLIYHCRRAATEWEQERMRADAGAERGARRGLIYWRPPEDNSRAVILGSSDGNDLGHQKRPAFLPRGSSAQGSYITPS